MTGVVTDIEPCYASATTLVVKVFELRDCLVLDSVAYRSFGMDASPYFEPKTITGAADALRAASSVRHPKPARPVCAKRLRPGASRSRPDERSADHHPRADSTACVIAPQPGFGTPNCRRRQIIDHSLSLLGRLQFRITRHAGAARRRGGPPRRSLPGSVAFHLPHVLIYRVANRVDRVGKREGG